MKKKLGNSKNKYLPITIYLIILIILVDALALVLYSGTKEQIVVEEPETPYYPGKTDPVKVEEMPTDTEIKVDKEKGCTKDLVNKIKKDADNIKFSYVPHEVKGGTEEAEDGGNIEITYNTLQIVIENLTPDLKISLRDNLVPATTRNYSYADAQEGKISFIPTVSSRVVTYYVTITSTNTECGEQVVKKMSVEAPMVNNMIVYEMCEGKDYVKECAYFTWKDYNPGDVLTAIAKADKSKPTTTTQVGVGDDNTTTTTAVQDNTTTTTKKADNANKEDKDKNKEEKGKFEFDNTMKIIVAVGIVAIVVVIAGAYVISKKRG